ncbi:MAG TPA: hypothetical protein DHV52_00390 [Parachlamydiales bacterium]|nr:MAG: hypothetical protein A2098_04025 [Chlamydiae bacterium GWF2_49_8]HCJ82790.1 hypothetical protein [Parachlamydiales bacterium]
MEMKMRYFLTEACKNSFVLFDLMDHSLLEKSLTNRIHRTLLEEKRDDALILVEGHSKEGAFYARMLVLGIDGEWGEFCGNGSRTCAAYLFSRYPGFQHYYLTTNQGDRPLLKYSENLYSIKLPPVRLELNPKFIGRPDLFQKEKIGYSLSFEGKRFVYAEAIEPHLVILGSLTDEELFSIGKKLNLRKELFPLGINVNGCQEKEKNRITVKTYERGVQRLTLSCGTGSSCSSTIFLRGESGSIHVATPGGDLEITISEEGLELKGPAHIEGSKELLSVD